MRPAIKVLLADDHPAIRAGIRSAIETKGFDVCAEVSNAADAVRAALNQHPDLCVIDVDMPGSGIEAARAITSLMPEAMVVMLAVSRDDDDLFAALAAGAAGYLVKDIDLNRFPVVLESVFNGEAVVPRELVGPLIAAFSDRESRKQRFRQGPGSRLTTRESEILELMKMGLTTSEIAERSFISQATVRSHIASALHKLEVPDRLSAIRLLTNTDGVSAL